MQWRNNLEQLLKDCLPEFKRGMPQIIMDAIDAAYLQGLEDGSKEE